MGKDAVEERERKGKPASRRAPRHVANWGEADTQKLMDALIAAADCGGCLRFGYSRDGGAYAIGVYGDGDPYTDFVGGGENIDDYLDDYVKLFEDIRDQRAMATQAPKKARNGLKDLPM